MKGKNVTKCIENNTGCLDPGTCCYECDFKGWCDLRCKDVTCRRKRVAKRLGKET